MKEKQPLVAVIGASPVTGVDHLKAAQSAGYDLAVVDTNPERTQALHQQFGATPFGSISAMLEKLSSDGRALHIAVVATPSALHLPHLTELALARRIGMLKLGGILLEKPPWLPRENSEAAELITDLDRDGLKVGVGMTTLFDEAFIGVTEAVQSGVLGQVISIEDEIYFQVTADMGLPPNYFRSVDEGGSTLLLNGVHGLHRIDKLARTDREPPGNARIIRSFEKRPSEQPLHFTPQADYGHFHISYPNGVTADMKVGWTAYPPEPSRFLVIAEQGTAAIYGNGDSWKITARGDDGEYRTQLYTRTKAFNKFQKQFDAMDQWVRTSVRPSGLPDLSDLMWTMTSLNNSFTELKRVPIGSRAHKLAHQPTERVSTH
ncbi:MAG: Gfo/Idh/MocA family oxidoreductase [Corynebacteriales bacterium]|nr:Gfo/Idh/MocA family oxidoreductase [Mycobacteriales bacterium]